METSDVRQVKKAQKNYRCDWCYEWIETGTSYSTWFGYSDRVTARMHPECYEAMLRADLIKYYNDQYLPTAGTCRRGCFCGENQEHCTCKEDLLREQTKQPERNDHVLEHSEINTR